MTTLRDALATALGALPDRWFRDPGAEAALILANPALRAALTESIAEALEAVITYEVDDDPAMSQNDAAAIVARMLGDAP